MCRLTKNAIFVVLLFSVIKISYAEDSFYRFNRDLDNIGNIEFSKTNTSPYKGEIYRLDPNFKLGHGDTLLINFWGKIEDRHLLVIDKDGMILIPRIGSIRVLGDTLDEAKAKVESALSSRYTNVRFEMSLSTIQDIRISVLGNVVNPGIYAISPFAKILDALKAAGGLTGKGSLRDIRLIRNDKIAASFDFYRFVIKGEESNNVALSYGDKLFIPIIENLVAIRGNVTRPGIYEVRKGANLSELIDIAGDVIPSKFSKKIVIMRFDEKKNDIVVTKEVLFEDFLKIKGTMDDLILEYNDTIIITSEFDFTPFKKDLMKTIAVEGEVVKPGSYEVRKDANLSEVIDIAGGVITSNSRKRIRIMGFNETKKEMVISKEILFEDFIKIKGTSDDYKLEYNDAVLVLNESDFSPIRKDLIKTVTVRGEIINPGSYTIQDGEKLSSLIKRFGGLTGWAYPEGVVFTRQILIEKQKEIIEKEIRAREIGIQEEEARLAESLMFKEERELRQAGIDRRKKALQLFAAQAPKGRIIIDLNKIIKGEDDIILEKGDNLYIPPIPDWVMISGAVYNPETVIFKEGNNINYYLNIVGGLTDKALADGVYIIKSNGNVLTKLKGNEIISRGDIVVVPEKEIAAKN